MLSLPKNNGTCILFSQKNSKYNLEKSYNRNDSKKSFCNITKIIRPI